MPLGHQASKTRQGSVFAWGGPGLPLGKDQRGDAAVSSQADRTVEEAVVQGLESCFVKPNPTNFKVLLKGAAGEGLVSLGQSQLGDIPGDQARIRIKLEDRLILTMAAVVSQGFHGQPLELGVVTHMGIDRLVSLESLGAIKARGARCGDQGVAVGLKVGVDIQMVPPHQAAGGMHEHVVADLMALGVQAFEHAQRAVVPMSEHGATFFNAVAKL